MEFIGKHYRWLFAVIGLTIILIVSFVSAISSLRQNYTTMLDLRQSVFDADRRGDQDLDFQLRALRNFVINHMNTDLQKTIKKKPGVLVNPNQEKPIQLAYSYYRDNLSIHRLELKKQLELFPEERTNIEGFEMAREKCEAVDSNGQAVYDISIRLACFQSAAIANSNGFYPQIEPLPIDYYVFDFPSPSWSSDRAGWSIVVGFVCLFSLVLVLVLWGCRVIINKLI